jgi:ribosomal protein S18 acetylase RimI-like enzyme
MNQGSAMETPRAAAWPLASPQAQALSALCGEGLLADVRLLPAGDEHIPLLRRVYASARAEEMATTGWSEADIEAFLAQQFLFQHQYYHEHYADAQFLVITRKNEAIGRLYWWCEGDRASLMDICLLPEHRGAGIGNAILTQLLAGADANGVTTALHVEPYNPALRLYERHGFEVIGTNGVYLKMHRLPKSVQQ